MIAVLSLWTNTDGYAKWTNFIDPVHYCYSWILSSVLAKRAFGEVHLYTDNKGYDFLIKGLQLKFDYVSKELENLTIDNRVWAAGKLYTYGAQTKPFAHIDHDVYLWKKPNDLYLSNDIFVQQIENYPDMYNSYGLEFLFNRKSVKWIPSYYNPTYCHAYNVGIIGGQNLDIIAHYVEDAFKFVKRNPEFLNDIEKECSCKSAVMLIIEQYALYCLTKYYDINVGVYLPKGQWEFNDKVEKGYEHLVYGFKQDKQIMAQLKGFVHRHLPNYYDRANNYALTMLD